MTLTQTYLQMLQAEEKSKLDKITSDAEKSLELTAMTKAKTVRYKDFTTMDETEVIAIALTGNATSQDENLSSWVRYEWLCATYKAMKELQNRGLYLFESDQGTPYTCHL